MTMCLADTGFTPTGLVALEVRPVTPREGTGWTRVQQRYDVTGGPTVEHRGKGYGECGGHIGVETVCTSFNDDNCPYAPVDGCDRTAVSRGFVVGATAVQVARHHATPTESCAGWKDATTQEVRQDTATKHYSAIKTW